MANKSKPARSAPQPLADLQTAFRCHQTGDLNAAAAGYQKVLATIPNQFDALHLLGVVELERNNPGRAVDLLRRALSIRPDVAAAHMNFANALRASGRSAEAFTHYERALALQPDFEQAHLNLAKTALEQGDYATALRHADRALALNAGNADGHNVRGNAALGLKDIQLAEEAFRTACGLSPGFAPAQTNLGNVLLQQGKVAEGMQHHREACKLAPASAVAQYNLGTALLKHGRAEESVEVLQRAVQLGPEMAEAWNGLGLARQAMGDFDLAIASFNRAIELRPGYAEAFRHLAKCGRAGSAALEIPRLQTLLQQQNLPVEGQVAIHFALGKLHDDEARFDEAFAHFKLANGLLEQDLIATGQAYDAQRFRARIEGIISTMTPRWLEERRGWGHPSNMPVFVLGAPRSGTSLVEQIVASHPEARGAGELRDIGQIVQLGVLDEPSKLRASAQAYLDRLRALAPGARIVTDKMPDNIFSLAAIAAMFPNARVILCRRDLRDTGLSCYMTRFSSSQYAFSFNLLHCGERLYETGRLADHWMKHPPLRLLEVSYESLVTDFASEARRLIDFLGLAWTPACLEFNKTRRAVTTASAWQVRQPIYQGSVGRWRHYEKHLEPLFAGLRITGQ